MSKFDLLILDVESYLYQACTACKTLHQVSEDIYAEVYNIKLGIQYIQDIVDKFKDKFMSRSIVLVIGDKNNNFRKGINPSYKAHRGSKPLMYDMILKWAIDNMEVISLPHLEADDICRIIFEDNDNFKGEKLIVTIDKDFYSVPCNLYRDNPKDNKIVTVTQEDAIVNEYVQVIMGDKTDGYSGIPNFGEKKARAFVTVETKWEDIVKLYIDNGLTEQDAILNYNMAHIVGYSDYNWLDKKVITK
jgi:DNA polymerase I